MYLELFSLKQRKDDQDLIAVDPEWIRVTETAVKRFRTEIWSCHWSNFTSCPVFPGRLS